MNDYANACTIKRDWVRTEVLEFFGQGDNKKKGPSVTEWLEKYIEKVPTLIKKNKKRPLSERTVVTYKTTLDKIRVFQEYKTKQLKLIDINLSFHEEFMEYLSQTERLRSSTTGVMIKDLKALCREEFEYPGFLFPELLRKKRKVFT
ncbi:phage integrase SAM-like domain-containing protein [Bacteroidetes bacterium endosymbiont of Geopemphigus sp.]|uniref:phage integrase SAM-like domain-containing protein n=1 Tax=Bacteroidetes bacterium endosymbiont of Geopemphigus sp. TaxID=2047937 RepID=UPI000CD03D62|nr:phage integrase SAM-like domain-containing protein [Bacteroidetes bacterium endosymbiont of Geopemphigus sp.]